MDIVMYSNILTILIFTLICICAVAFLRLKKRKSIINLIFFTLFFIYIFKVLDYTLFQFQSLLLLKYFTPNLILKGQSVGNELNLIPFVKLTLQDIKTSLLNILLFVPFGFGLPFISKFRLKWIVVLGALFSISIETMQLITGLMAKITFRIADINDVIFNTFGVLLGYIIFVGFVRTCYHLSENQKITTNPILRYITERPQFKK